uniref:Uncharacterized protein n=1 Tax=Glossina austeni TaxID=7395 RepID=A0A1A9VMJ2_GLOAU
MDRWSDMHNWHGMSRIMVEWTLQSTTILYKVFPICALFLMTTSHGIEMVVATQLCGSRDCNCRAKKNLFTLIIRGKKPYFLFAAFSASLQEIGLCVNDINSSFGVIELLERHYIGY